MGKVFNNPDVVARSWYVACRAKNLRGKKLVSKELGKRKIVAYRGSDGVARVVGARCPHLGADLGLGEVCDTAIRCPYHHWEFGDQGQCRKAPGYDVPPKRKLRVYPTVEKWGLIWFFNGPEIGFPLPDPPSNQTRRTFLLPPQTIESHPHLVLGNGLDVGHFGALHEALLWDVKQVETSEPFTKRIGFNARFKGRFQQYMTGTVTGDVKASFATTGGSLAWMNIIEPFGFDALFTGSSTKEGFCLTQSILFFRSLSPRYIARCLALTAILLRNDRRVLDTLEFSGGFASQDAIFEDYAKSVEGFKTW